MALGWECQPVAGTDDVLCTEAHESASRTEQRLRGEEHWTDEVRRAGEAWVRRKALGLAGPGIGLLVLLALLAIGGNDAD